MLLLLRLWSCVAMGRVEGGRRGQGRVGISSPLSQTQAQVVMSTLLDKKLLQAAVGGHTGQEVLVGGKHAAELLVEAAGIRLTD